MLGVVGTGGDTTLPPPRASERRDGAAARPRVQANGGRECRVLDAREPLTLGGTWLRDAKVQTHTADTPEWTIGP